MITYGELVYGAEKSQKISQNLAKVHRIREIFPVIELSCSIMDTFGSLKAELGRNGEVVDDFDLIIAATAITMGIRRSVIMRSTFQKSMIYRWKTGRLSETDKAPGKK